MKKALGSLFLGCILLAACSMTLPVRGKMADSDETFTGSATGYMDGAGHLSIVSDKGTSCSGSFVYVSSRRGEGIFNCEDGRTGPFQFVSTGTRGNGYGELDGRRFTFSFGREFKSEKKPTSALEPTKN